MLRTFSAAPGELAGHTSQWGVMSEGPALTRGWRETRAPEGREPSSAPPTQGSGCATPTASFPSFPLPVTFQIFLNRYLAFRIHRKHLLLSPALPTRSPAPLPSKMSCKMENNQIPLSLRLWPVGLSRSPIHFLPNLFPVRGLTTSLDKFSLLSLSFSLLLPPLPFPPLPPLLTPPPSPPLLPLPGSWLCPPRPSPEKSVQLPGAARPPLLLCPPTMRSGSSHLPIKAKCMLPAADQNTFPVLSCGSPPSLSPGSYVLKVR